MPNSRKVLLWVIGLVTISILVNLRSYQYLFPILFPSQPWEYTADNEQRKKVLALQPKIFHCGGYALNRNFQPTLQSILPEYSWHNIKAGLKSPWTSLSFPNSSSTHPWDILLMNYELDDCIKCSNRTASFHRWLQLDFQGKIIFWTPEVGPENFNSLPIRKNFNYDLGPGKPGEQRMTLTFLQTAFWAQLPPNEKVKLLTRHLRSQSSIERRRPHFLIYASSHCVGVRQKAFRQLATDDTLPTVHYGGRCNGGITQNQSRATKYENGVRLSNWEDNVNTYQEFRFCLTMEHANRPGYITEKILVAFWGGCVPIYWGSAPEIFEIFNQKAFIYWNVTEPSKALEQIRYLERNWTAYQEVLQEPILAPGALENYFSLDKTIGGGATKAKIRSFLGLDDFEYEQV